MTKPIKMDEWLLEAFSRTVPRKSGATVREISETSGRAPEFIREAIRRAIDAGKVGCRNEIRASISGFRSVPSYYRILKPPKKGGCDE